jgi:hypothetical protein
MKFHFPHQTFQEFSMQSHILYALFIITNITLPSIKTPFSISLPIRKFHFIHSNFPSSNLPSLLQKNQNETPYNTHKVPLKSNNPSNYFSPFNNMYHSTRSW